MGCRPSSSVALLCRWGDQGQRQPWWESTSIAVCPAYPASSVPLEAFVPLLKGVSGHQKPVEWPLAVMGQALSGASGRRGFNTALGAGVPGVPSTALRSVTALLIRLSRDRSAWTEVTLLALPSLSNL